MHLSGATTSRSTPAEHPPSVAGQPTDEVLLARFAAHRDAEAFGQLVGRHLARVRGTARRICTDPATADDIAQAVFILLARRAEDLSRRSLLGPTGYVAGFLHRATVLTALDVLRAQRRRHRRERAAARPEQAPVAAATSSPDLDTILNALPQADRAVLLCRYWQGRSISATADHLGMTRHAAAKRLTRALARLRKKLPQPPHSRPHPDRTSLPALPAALSPFTPDPTMNPGLRPESLVTQTVRNSLPPAAATALPPFVLVAAAALRRWAFLQAAKTTLAILAVATGIAASSATAAHFMSETPVPAATPPLAAANVEVPPAELQGDGLVEWLIARNEQSLSQFARMSFDLRTEWVSESNAEPEVRLESWLIDEPRRKVVSTAVKVVTFMPDGRKLRRDHKTIQIITPEQFIECLPATQQTSIYRPDPAGFHSKATFSRFYDAEHPLRMLAGGTGPQRLKTQFEIRNPNTQWTAARVVLPGGRVVYTLTTLWNSPDRQVIHKRYLDPGQGYLMTSVDVEENRVVVQTLRTESTVIDGIDVPTRIVRTSQPEDRRITTIELSNVRMNPEISPEAFSFESLPLPATTLYGIETHGQEKRQTVLRDGKDHLTEDSPRFREAMQRWSQARIAPPPATKPLPAGAP